MKRNTLLDGATGGKRSKIIDVQNEKLWYGEYEVEAESEPTKARLKELAKAGLSFELPEDLEIRVFRKVYTQKIKAYVGFVSQINEYDKAFEDSRVYTTLNGLPTQEPAEVNGLLQGSELRAKIPAFEAPDTNGDAFAIGAFSEALSKAGKSASAIKWLHGHDPEDALEDLTETVKISARVPRGLTDYEKYGYKNFTEMVVAGLKYVTGTKH